jgi:hypothetical protein
MENGYTLSARNSQRAEPRIRNYELGMRDEQSTGLVRSSNGNLDTQCRIGQVPGISGGAGRIQQPDMRQGLPVARLKLDDN